MSDPIHVSQAFKVWISTLDETVARRILEKKYGPPKKKEEENAPNESGS